MRNPEAGRADRRDDPVMRTQLELEAAVAHLRAAPADAGTLALIVRRPGVDTREVLETGVLDLDVGLVGDSWASRDRVDPLAQLNVMSARMVELLASDPAEQALAGDQLYLDLDIGVANLPVGSRLAIGTAVIEVTPKVHRGCAKFAHRFGEDAARFVNSVVGNELRLRGFNARVVVAGTVHRGDPVTKV
jgi:hypothetical protein